MFFTIFFQLFLCIFVIFLRFSLIIFFFFWFLKIHKTLKNKPHIHAQKMPTRLLSRSMKVQQQVSTAGKRISARDSALVFFPPIFFDFSGIFLLGFFGIFSIFYLFIYFHSNFNPPKPALNTSSIVARIIAAKGSHKNHKLTQKRNRKRSKTSTRLLEQITWPGACCAGAGYPDCACRISLLFCRVYFKKKHCACFMHDICGI